jgi:hypothetical protein
MQDEDERLLVGKMKRNNGNGFNAILGFKDFWVRKAQW